MLYDLCHKNAAEKGNTANDIKKLIAFLNVRFLNHIHISRAIIAQTQMNNAAAYSFETLGCINSFSCTYQKPLIVFNTYSTSKTLNPSFTYTVYIKII